MKRVGKTAAAHERKRRADAVVSRAKSGSVPRGLKLVSFRDLTPAERARGKSLTSRAAALLAAKAQKVVVSR